MTAAIPKATPPKQEFVDKYPYIVYTDHHTIVYSDTPETSIDDISGGGGDATEYEIHSAFVSEPDPEEHPGELEFYEAEAPFVYKAVKGDEGWTPDLETGAITKAKAGDVLICSFEQNSNLRVTLTPLMLTSALPESPASEAFRYPLVLSVPIGTGIDQLDVGLLVFTMPAQNAWAIVVDI